MNSEHIMSEIAGITMIAETQAWLVSRAGASTQHTEMVLREIVERLKKLTAPTYMLDPVKELSDDESLVRDLKGVVGVVEATREEEHGIWSRLMDHRDPPVRWQQHGGHGRTIGYLDGLPVHVSLSFTSVAGHRILFYHATSRVVDHQMVRDYINLIIPDTAKKSDGRTNHSDATNFTNVLPRGWSTQGTEDTTE